MKRDAAGVRLQVRIEAEFQQQFHSFESRLRRPLESDAFDPADTCSRLQGADVQQCVDFRVRAVRQKEFHQLDVARLGGPQKSSRAVFIQPLIRENGPGFRAVLHASVDVGALGDEQLDEIEVIHIRFTDRVVAVLDVAVVRREIQGRPSALVGKVRIGAAV